jgi:hypothetical protein
MPINPAIGGALVSGATSAISDLLTNSGNRANQKRADQYNQAQWNRQNEYNDPSAQMARLRKAGLNPNLIYGSSSAGATGQASPAPLSKAAPYSVQNPLKDITQFANLRAKDAQTNNSLAQNSVITQDAILKAAQIQQTAANTKGSKIQNDIAQNNLNYAASFSEENLRQLENATIQSDIETSFKSQSVQNRVKDLYYRAQLAKHNSTGVQLDNTYKRIKNDLAKIGIFENSPWYTKILSNLKSQFDAFNNNTGIKLKKLTKPFKK